MLTRRARRPSATDLDVHRIRSHFDFVRTGRVVTNNAASTQPPRELIDLYRRLAPWYENVHRGQSTASRRTTELFESSYDTIAAWLNAPSRRCIATFRNTTEALNAVMYSLMTEFRDGDNVVTTMLEHNFFGTKPGLRVVRRIADESGYPQPNGERRSLLVVDGAQLVPTTAVDVQALDVDYLCFSFHKLLAPFGVGVLYAKEHLLRDALPFLYGGGDMIAEGQVTLEHVAYNRLPWKYAAGTPNILGVIVSAQALRFLVDLVAAPGDRPYFEAADPLPRPAVEQTMTRIGRHTRTLTPRRSGRSARSTASPSTVRQRATSALARVANQSRAEGIYSGR